jgi:uncharacterized linocin/CFP29 family protein
MASPAMAAPGGTAPPTSQEDEGQELSLFHKENAKVPWPEETWKAIHKTVHDETMRVRVGAKYLPHARVHPKTTSVQQDMVVNGPLPGEQLSTLTVDEGTTIRLNEIWTEFALTTQQVHETAEAKNPEHTTAVTLARRAAQYLALGQDIVIHQGNNGYNAPFFASNLRYRQPYQPLDGGLLSLNGGPYASPNTPIQVPPLDSPPALGVRYGENTFTAVTQAYANLTAQGQPGPYALILNEAIYADLYAAVGLGTLVITADRVEPLVKAGLFGTGTIPPNASLSTGNTLTSPLSSPPTAPFYGVMVSLGGRTMELVVGLHATTVYTQQDLNQLWRFRVLERFALRVIDTSAIQVFEFN